MRQFITTVVAAFALVSASACGVSQVTAPTPVGPSTSALALTMTTTPDSLTADGGSQSAVAIQASNASGGPQVGLPIRIELAVAGTPESCGTLSGSTVVTDANGHATAVYTAPAMPLPLPQCTGFAGVVTVIATPSGSNFQTTSSRSSTIRLTAAGTILPPAGSPTAAFIFTPIPATAGVPLHFDASSSQVGTGATQITTYSWDFGDGTSGTGRTPTHTYSSAATYTVTLTVTNDRGLSASTTQTVSVAVPTTIAPTAKFTSSPATPVVNQNVFFNASSSTAAVGHTLTNYSWDFGDGSSGTGVTPSHAYAASGTFTVTLSVTDDAGQTGIFSNAVAVNSASGAGGSTTAAFSFSPTTPSALQPVFFNASTSTPATGHTLVTYAWNFGDGTTITGATVAATHTFAVPGTYSVNLTVTDDIGHQGSTAQQVIVAAAGTGSLTAAFSISPTNPTSGQLVSFNASQSSPIASITSYDWDFGDGTVVNGQTSFLINHTYFTNTGNSYTIVLTVHDNTGRVATTTQPLAVGSGGPPIPSFTVSPSPATVGATVTFTSTGAAEPSYTWNFGDGSLVLTTAGNTTSHSYSATGSYVIRLTVTDNNGQSNTTTRTLLVQ